MNIIPSRILFWGSNVSKIWGEKKINLSISCWTAIQHPDISWDQNLRQLRLSALIQQRAPSNAVIPRKRNSIAISHPILAVSENPPSSILYTSTLPSAVQPPSTLIGLLLPLSFRRSVSINTDLIYFAGK